jgi:hypothetical protein
MGDLTYNIVLKQLFDEFMCYILLWLGARIILFLSRHKKNKIDCFEENHQNIQT